MDHSAKTLVVVANLATVVACDRSQTPTNASEVQPPTGPFVVRAVPVGSGGESIRLDLRVENVSGRSLLVATPVRLQYSVRPFDGLENAVGGGDRLRRSYVGCHPVEMESSAFYVSSRRVRMPRLLARPPPYLLTTEVEIVVLSDFGCHVADRVGIRTETVIGRLE